MDVFEAIRTRRSIGRVKPDPVPEEMIEKLLEGAVWAPNHYCTEPWKFFVLTGEGRRPLGRMMAEVAREEMDDPTTDVNRERLVKQEAKAFRAPVVVAVAVTPSEKVNVVWQEEVAAVSAAVQNMLLTAHALGLGAIWRTGKFAYHPKVKKLFGLKEKDAIVGFIYVGYPEGPAPLKERPSFKDKTVWMTTDRPYDRS